MAFEYPDATFIGSILTTLFLGVYITVFGLYVKITRARRGSLTVIDYGIIALFVLCVCAVVIDSVQQFYSLMRGAPPFTEKLNAATSTLSLTLDFISQMILVYRCWVVWGRSTWVGLPPAFLALVSYATGLCVTIDLATRIGPRASATKSWWIPLGVASMSLSLAVNTIVSTLMISRIWFVYRQTKSAVEHAGRSLLWVSSILLESAVALFVAQLVYLTLYKLRHPGFAVIAGPVTVIYGLNCTAIMVRVGLNQSFNETKTTSASHSTLMFGKVATRHRAGTGNTDKTYEGSATELDTIPSQSEKHHYGNTYPNGTDTTVVNSHV